MIGGINIFNIVLVLAVLITVLLIMFLGNIIKITEKKEIIIEEIKEEPTSTTTNNEETNELPEIDLVEITKKLEESTSNKKVALTKYEEEQEAKSIISYDELLNTQAIPVISYTQEIDLGGLSVKTVDSKSLAPSIDPNEIDIEEITDEDSKESHKSILISYDKEEEFLVTLKRLQSMIE